MTITEILEL